MIERFNFYDVYGYFVPGFALLSLMWLPCAMLGRPFPGSGSEFSLTVAAIVLAYVLGHFLQAISAAALPSQVRDSRGNRRDLSELMLDPGEPGLTGKLKMTLSARAAKLSWPDLATGETGKGGDDPISRARQEVFRMARAELVREGKAAYVEQFEGMYSLMRGLTTAFALCAAYYTGWALALLDLRWLRLAAFGAVCGGLVVAALLAAEALRRGAKRTNPEELKELSAAQREEKSTRTELWNRLIGQSIFSLVILATFALGYLLGFRIVRCSSEGGMLAIAGAGALLASLKFYGGYRRYARLFAVEVWESFLSCSGTNPP